MMEPFLEAGKMSRFPFPLYSDSTATSKWMPPNQVLPGIGAAAAAAATAESLQSCLPPCDPIDSSPPGSPVPGIL